MCLYVCEKGMLIHVIYSLTIVLNSAIVSSTTMYIEVTPTVVLRDHFWNYNCWVWGTIWGAGDGTEVRHVPSKHSTHRTTTLAPCKSLKIRISEILPHQPVNLAIDPKEKKLFSQRKRKGALVPHYQEHNMG